MNNLKPLKALSVFCSLVFCAAQSQAETLKDIYDLAVQNDHQYRAAEATLEAGKEFKAIGRARLLPQIGADASWTDRSTEGKLAPVVGVENVSNTEQEQLAYGITLTQSLVDLGAWHTYGRGKILNKNAYAQFAAAEQSLVLRAAQAYFDALRAVDNLNTAKAEENALSHQLEQTNQRFEVGLNAITEVHEAQAAFDSATANRLVSEGDLGIAFEALEVITGRSYSKLSPLKELFPVKPPEPLDRAEWEAFALTSNADLKQARYRAEASKASVKISRSGHYPTLTGSLNYGVQDGESTFDSNPDTRQFTDTDTTTVQLSLSVPLFSGGGVSASRRQAYSLYLSDNELYLQAKRDTVQAVRSTHLGVLTSAAIVKARKQAITSNESALEATRAGYDVGTRDLVDVLNAQRNLYTAQRDYFSALYSYVVSTLQLRQAAGILTGEQITELDQWLDKANPVRYERP